ncbi:thiamine-phosphate kinase [Fibrobacter sp.]
MSVDLGEFKFIDSVLKKSLPMGEFAPERRGWLPVGDDCAMFDGWLVTKDLSVEGTHFRMDWSSPEQAVEKHIVSNVSDISSMGGVPRFAVCGLCVNRGWSDEVRTRVGKALAEGFARRGIALIGGDTVAGECGMFSTTLLGTCAGGKPLVRSGAKPGDAVFVAGTLGKSAAGLWLLLNHPEARDEFPTLVNYHLAPVIDERCGACLVELGVSGACMDISDGLSSELNHLAGASHVGIEIDCEKLPVAPEVLRMAERYGLDPLDFALNGGEEYELLFTESFKNDIFLEKGALPGGAYRIGTVVEGTEVRMRGLDGKVSIVKAQAWSHL